MIVGDILEYQRYLVFGAGRSGRAAARLLRVRGKDVILYDEAPEERLAEARALAEEIGAEFLTDPAALLERFYQVIILSPGIPETHPVVYGAEQQGVLVRSELELGFQCCPAPVVGITGTNGKTTVTYMLEHLLREAGRPALMAGNVGRPLSDAAMDPAMEQPGALAVCEVSSFQLETIEAFQPEVAAVLNLTPDHMDRYGSMEQYLEAKRRITENQTQHQHLVLNEDDRLTRSIVSRSLAQPWFFSLRRAVRRGAWLENGRLMLRTRSTAEPLEVMPREALPLPGLHNVANALAALCLGAACGLEPAQMAEALGRFQAVPHRIEFVGAANGVRWYNDSKATNLASMRRAIESFDEPLGLIVGGRDKGAPWQPLAPLVRSRVRVLVALGEAAEIALEAWGGEVETALRAGDMAEAVALLREQVRPGEVALLSPACSSFDQYDSFEERGEDFRRLVREFAQP